MFLFFAISTIYVQKTIADFTHEGKVDSIAQLQMAIDNELAFADRMPAGYERRFELPLSIQGLSYTITVHEEVEPLRDAIIITYPDESAILYVRENITGTLYPGANTIRKTNTLILN
jgi:hypothetical protein